MAGGGSDLAVVRCPLYPQPHSVCQPGHTRAAPQCCLSGWEMQLPPGSRNGLLTPAPPCTMLDWKGKAYLAGTQGRPQMWSGGCWRHHRNEQSGLLSQRNLYLSTLRLRTRKKVLAAPGICSNSRQLNITLFWLYCLLKTKEKLICRLCGDYLPWSFPGSELTSQNKLHSKAHFIFLTPVCKDFISQNVTV